MWPDSTLFWRDKRVVVTGGAGFLGSFVVEKLHARNAVEVCVPRIEDYDLRDLAAIRRMLADARPDIILHPSTPLRAGSGGAGGRDPTPLRYGEATRSARTANIPPSSSTTCLMTPAPTAGAVWACR